MPRPNPKEALKEARAALEAVPTEKKEKGVITDNTAFSLLIDAVIALKRISEEGSDEYRELDDLHEEIIDTYTNIEEDAIVDVETRAEYHNALFSIRQALEDKYDVTFGE